MASYLTSNHHRFQTFDKSVFLTNSNTSNNKCEFCQLFNSQETGVNDQEINLTENPQRTFFKQKDFSSTKQSKKSLKSHAKLNQFFSNTLISTHPPKYFYQPQPKISNSNFHLTRDVSKVFSKTTTSQPGFNFYKKAAVNYSQASSLKHITFQNSCQNFNNNLQKIQLQNSYHNSNQAFIDIPLVQSINKKCPKRSNSFGHVSIGSSKTFHPQNTNFNKIRFVMSVSQNMASLPISPVKDIIIPEQSEGSGQCQQSPTYQDFINSPCKIQFTAPPALNRNVSEDYSDLLRTTLNKKSSQLTKNHLLQESMSQNLMPQIRILNESKLSSRNSRRDFHQMLIHQEEEQSVKQKSFSSHNKSNKHQSNNMSTSSKDQHKATAEFNEQKISQRQIASHSSKPEQDQNFQKYMITTQKPNKTQSSLFGRYSAEVPKSNKFSTMKVRRTISMKDQQDSSQEQTSEVIYGFRKTNKLQVMQDIAQDMQQSCMTRIDQKQSASKYSNFHEF